MVKVWINLIKNIQQFLLVNRNIHTSVIQTPKTRLHGHEDDLFIQNWLCVAHILSEPAKVNCIKFSMSAFTCSNLMTILEAWLNCSKGQRSTTWSPADAAPIWKRCNILGIYSTAVLNSKQSGLGCFMLESFYEILLQSFLSLNYLSPNKTETYLEWGNLIKKIDTHNQKWKFSQKKITLPTPNTSSLSS